MEELNLKKRILLKLTSSRLWGSLIVTGIAGYIAITSEIIEVKLGALGFIAAAWGLYDFSKKVIP